MDAVISPEKLQDIIDRYGDDPEAWPEYYRLFAETLIERAELKAILEEARALRVALRKLGPAAPSCLSERIVALALEIDPPTDDGVLPFPPAGRC